MSKKIDISAADMFLNQEELDAANETNSNRKTIIVSDIFDNIIDNRLEGGTHSFYLTNKTFNALVAKAKTKKISTSKFLEGILSQLFFESE